MGQVKDAEPVKFFCGILAADRTNLAGAEQGLESVFGEIDLKSDLFDFDFTSYYEAEMGANLIRQFVCFKELRSPDRIATFKRQTNDLESEFAHDSSRTINLDPGYIAPSKLVLASTKDFSHRIYIAEGIYAEVTLNFRGGGCKHFEWTFPDFQSHDYQEFFLLARSRLMEQRK
jgi:hypothetical protein